MNNFFTKSLLICTITLTIGFLPVTKAQALLVVIEDGCSPDFWKDNTAKWLATGFLPGQSVQSVFSGAFSHKLSRESLLQAVMSQRGEEKRFHGRGEVKEAARTLIRVAVAALLNSAHPDIDFPLTTTEVINEVNTALASRDQNIILALADQLRVLDDELLFPCPFLDPSNS